MNSATLSNQVGMILHGMYMSGYFETEDLEESLQQLIADRESTIGITIQTELPNIYTLLDQVNFEKRIVDFNERQRASEIIRDIYEIIQDNKEQDISKNDEKEG